MFPWPLTDNLSLASIAGSLVRTNARTAARKATGAATRKGGRGRHVASEVHEDELSPAPAGSQSLVIVESPAKAKTIGKYLGRGYRVRATVGHIMDLPEKKLGIDIEGGFEPELIPIPGKEKTIAELKSAAKDSRDQARRVLDRRSPARERQAAIHGEAPSHRREKGRDLEQGRGRPRFE